MMPPSSISRAHDQPPWLARRLVGWIAPARNRVAMLADLDEEFRTHALAEWSRTRARRWYWRQALGSIVPMARSRLGNDSPSRRSAKARRHKGNGFDMLARDLRFAVRGLICQPGFTAVAVTTLALGIGINAAMFSVVEGVVLRPLPYTDPDRLVRFAPDRLFSNEVAEVAAVREQVGDLFEVAAYARALAIFTGEGDAEVARGAMVSDNHFEVLGARPLLGRTFTAGEGEPGRSRVLVLAHGLWQRRYGGDVEIVGRAVQVSGVDYTVIGVMGPEYQPMENDWTFWQPMFLDPSPDGRAVAVIARLRPGVTAEQATDRYRAVMRDYWEGGGALVEDSMLEPLRAAPLQEWILGDVGPRLLLLMAAVAFVLLIACANVANLLLARGSVRAGEIAVRSALGAGTGRLVRQLMTESALLGLAGGLAGIAMAGVGLRVGLASLPDEIPRAANIGIDFAVLGFALGMSTLAALAFGLAPAWRTVSRGRAAGLSEGWRGSSASRGQIRLNNALVASEVALTVVLVVGAGLMLRSFWKLTSVNPGFEREGVVTLRPIPDASRYPTAAEFGVYHQRVIEALERVPEVESAGGIMFLPMTPGGFWGGFYPAESPPPEGANLPSASGRLVFPRYFETMRIPMLRGRDFDPTDDADSAPVTVINATLAEHAWPGEDPLGRRLFTMGEQRTVVGVVGDVRQTDLRTSSVPEAYFPYGQRPFRAMYFTARVRGDARERVGAIQAALRSVDPTVPIVAVTTMDDIVAATVSGSRFFTVLAVSFAGLALGLGMVGVYGVTAHVVAQRAHETGVRMALGADAARVARHTVGRGLRPVLVGAGLGLVVARATSRVLARSLFEIHAADPLTFVAVPTVLVLVAAVALYGPARRASRVDPIEVLRAD